MGEPQVGMASGKTVERDAITTKTGRQQRQSLSYPGSKLCWMEDDDGRRSQPRATLVPGLVGVAAGQLGARSSTERAAWVVH